MQPGRQFGSWSLAAACATILLAQAFHPIMLSAITAGEMAAWLSMLAAGLLALALYWPITAGLARLPGGNLIDLARAAAGEAGAIVTGFLLSALLVLHSGFILRQTAEMAVSSVYPHTPQTFATVALIMCVFYGAYGGLAALVRLCRLFLPVLALTILLILAGAFGWGQITYLLPLWGPGPVALLSRSFLLTSLYAPALFLLVAAGAVRDRRHLVRAMVAALAGAMALFAMTKVVLMMTFPFPTGRYVTFPLHELSRLVMGGRFFERIDGVWLLVWVFATGCHLAAMIHAAAVAFGNAFRMPGHRPAVLPFVTMALVIAFFPPDQYLAIAWHALLAAPALAVAYGLPAGLALVAAWRGRLSGRAL